MSQASPVYQEVVYVRVFAMKLKAISEILSNAIVNAAENPMEQHLQRMLLSIVQILKLRKVKTLSKICCEWCVPLVL